MCHRATRLKGVDREAKKTNIVSHTEVGEQTKTYAKREKENILKMTICDELPYCTEYISSKLPF